MRRSHAVVARSARVILLRSATLLLIIVAVAGTLGAVFLSPYALTRLSANPRIDWSRLSNVGQTYGAASAILAALALGGVAVSLFFQRRESRAAREQALRGLHMDLLTMALDDPEFMACWGVIGESTDGGWHRQHTYLNLVVSHWQMMWEMGVLSERHLRLAARGVFGGSPGLRFWSEVRDLRSVAERGRRARAFHAIVDEEYLRIEAAQVEAPTQPETGPGVDNSDPITGAATSGCGTGSLGVIGSSARHTPDTFTGRAAWFGLGAAVAWALGRIRRTG